ncbi:3-carboxy-cis,cis-muconate cycloisomerase [Streptomyces sp. SID3212]|uniref:3-carboxy-cis,cis-muconate cycloisomerase n=1 Tax=Streptomyces sp. SID3212 TaxID=2690259 RepID=UPI001368C24F|nr:3-carboxy-cis,cis-muconate cycloisomerase [Streptomyces sp. SID3212]MYV53652.1 3-carboxy-cis,cis-muconate cycloisomerase [Streptomyces sp. SID3212]
MTAVPDEAAAPSAPSAPSVPSVASEVGLLAPVWAGTGVESLVSDEAYLRAMLEVEVALTETQAELGVVPAASLGPLREVARGDRIDLAALAREARDAANPVVGLVRALTAEVAKVDREAAEHVHLGSTSQDILDSALMLVARRVLRRIHEDLVRTADGLALLAARHRDTPMAGRTLTQHAVPITFGLKAAGWLALVLDADDRVRRLLSDGLPAQLGGAAGTLAAYGAYGAYGESGGGAGGDSSGTELVEPFAERLGLTAPLVPWHSLRTPIADLGAVLSFVSGALGKIAVDVQGMARTEVAEAAEPSGGGRGASSAMPQKRNPVLATLIMSAARQVPPIALVLTQSLVSEDERSAGGWHAEWQPLRECLRLAAGAASSAAELADGLAVFPDRMRANLELTGGALYAERVNVVLAPLLGKAEAKHLLARLSGAGGNGGAEGGASGNGTSGDGGSFAELLAAAPETAGRFADPEALRALLRPEGYLGASGVLVDRVLARHAKHHP